MYLSNLADWAYENPIWLPKWAYFCKLITFNLCVNLFSSVSSPVLCKEHISKLIRIVQWPILDFQMASWLLVDCSDNVNNHTKFGARITFCIILVLAALLTLNCLEQPLICDQFVDLMCFLNHKYFKLHVLYFYDKEQLNTSNNICFSEENADFWCRTSV